MSEHQPPQGERERRSYRYQMLEESIGIANANQALAEEEAERWLSVANDLYEALRALTERVNMTPTAPGASDWAELDGPLAASRFALLAFERATRQGTE